jgi:hypothetical protein
MHVLTVLCAGGWMPENLSEGWRRLGCEVHEILYGTHMGRDWSRSGHIENAKFNADLLALARRLKDEGRLDLIFAVIYDDVLQVSTARSLRSLGVPMVNYHVDLVGQWYRILRTGQWFDRLACAQEANWGGLKRAGLRPYLMPMAANPSLVGAAGDGDAGSFDGVLYLGSPWLNRRMILADLAREGVPLRVYGHNWLTGPRQAAVSRAVEPVKFAHDLVHYLLPRLREEGLSALAAIVRERIESHGLARTPAADLPPEVVRGVYASSEFASLVRGAAVNLGFTHFSGRPGTPDELRQARLREFEIPMLGGFYLTQRCAEVAGFYREGEHLACWDDSGELREKIHHYLAHPEERARIATEGQRHAISHHTWELRFQGLLAELGLLAPMGAA